MLVTTHEVGDLDAAPWTAWITLAIRNNKSAIQNQLIPNNDKHREKPREKGRPTEN